MEENSLQNSKFKVDGVKYHEKINEVAIHFFGGAKKVFQPAGIYATEFNVYISHNNLTKIIPMYMIQSINVYNSKTIRKSDKNKGLFYNRRDYDAHDALLFEEENKNGVVVNINPPIILYNPEIQFLLTDIVFKEVNLNKAELNKILKLKDNPLICIDTANKLKANSEFTIIRDIGDIVDTQANNSNCTHHITIEALTGEKRLFLNAKLVIINNFLIISGKNKHSMSNETIYVNLNLIKKIEFKKIDGLKNKRKESSIYSNNEYRFLFSDSIIEKLKIYEAWIN